ncbi:MAG TPA: ectonucleotide pyrophosphatase/phosphodiesterase [Myxococcales bacterium]|jgi:predicted AlkP superfamily pyrophosphatase or phosphodiesterase
MPSRRHAAVFAIAWLALALSCACPKSAPSAARQQQQPAPAKPLDRVLIVSVDGMGQAVLQACPAPALRALMARGSSTLSAITTNTAKTLPSHVSMLTGVTPEKHGVGWNDTFRDYPKVPTIFEAAKRHRPSLTTGMVAGKPKFRTFERPGALDWSFVPETDEAVDDELLAQKAIALLREQRPNLLVLHLPAVDRTGHASGWGSAEQCQALAKADQAIGQVLEALRSTGLANQTAVIVTADHGGSDHTHSPTDGKSMRIPWIVAGPGIRAGFDLATVAGLEVHIEDTFATASWLLGLPMEAGIDGRPVVQVREAAAP